VDVLLQTLLECLLELLGSLFYDAVMRSRNAYVQTAANSLVAVVVAALLSALSLTMHPQHLIPQVQVRIAALATIPILNGCVLVVLGRGFVRWGRPRSAFEHFVPAFLFSLVFGAVRFIGAR
jgi:hypothetical protein